MKAVSDRVLNAGQGLHISKGTHRWSRCPGIPMPRVGARRGSAERVRAPETSDGAEPLVYVIPTGTAFP